MVWNYKSNYSIKILNFLYFIRIQAIQVKKNTENYTIRKYLCLIDSSENRSLV